MISVVFFVQSRIQLCTKTILMKRVLVLYLCLLLAPFLLSAESNSKSIHVGDICHVYDGSLAFSNYEDYINKDSIIGVVYSVKGNKISIVNTSELNKASWSTSLIFVLNPNNIPYTSGEYSLILLKKEYKISLQYSKNKRNISDFVCLLNQWFESNGLYEWSCYLKDGIYVVQYAGFFDDQTGYDFILNSKSFDRVNGCDTEIPVINSTCRNRAGQYHWVCGMNIDRMKSYCTNGTGLDFNPSDTDVIDVRKKLYTIVPVSYKFFVNNRKLKQFYHTYNNYLKNCMVDKEDTLGVMSVKTGRIFTEVLANQSIITNKLKISQYPAANIAYSKSFKYKGGTIQMWLPCMYELAEIMLKINHVNKSIKKIAGWYTIDSKGYYWSCNAVNTYYAWFYHSDGMTDANSQSLNLEILQVTEILL